MFYDKKRGGYPWGDFVCYVCMCVCTCSLVSIRNTRTSTDGCLKRKH